MTLLPRLNPRSLPKLQPSSIDERIRKVCQHPKINAFWKYLSPSTASVGVPLPIPPEFLPVDAYVEETKEWSTYGAEPWLDSKDEDASYITTNTINKTMSYFTFQDTTLSTISLCNLMWQTRFAGLVGWASYSVYIWDGAWQFVTNVSEGDPAWKTITRDVTSYLNTPAKVNAARLYFRTIPDVYDYVRITYANLYVEA